MKKTLIKQTRFNEAWQQFVSTGNLSCTPKNIQESWKRCSQMGLDPRDDRKAISLDEKSAQERLQYHSDLHQILISHHQNIQKYFDYVPIAIMFSDDEGYLLSASGHEDIMKLLDQGGVKTGASISEGSIGSNAPGICITEGRPAGVIAEEHYYQAFHWASCIATPIHNKEKGLIGALDFTSTVHYGKELNNLIPLLFSISNSIRFELLLKRRLQQMEIYDSYFHNIFHYSGSVLILVNTMGRVIELNRTGQELFSVRPEEIIHQDVKKILGSDSKINPPLKGFSSNKIILPARFGSKAYSIQSMPIFDSNENEVAYLLKLEKTKAVATSSQKTSYITKYSFDDIIGQSKSMVDLVRLARKVSRTQSNILIEGETGTGKELFAQSIHKGRCCHTGPFIAINCAAVPKELIESELFGYEKGAYSGARREGNTGKFELANEGTLFLDEIHAMDLSAQMKILRAIEDRSITRIGGKSSIPLNIRIIAACSLSLKEEVEKGNFLAALYFRLNVVRLRIPKLRERKEDIPLLVDHFIRMANVTFRRSIKSLDNEAMRILQKHFWPGNVRELKNCIECAFNLCEEQVIPAEDILIDSQPINTMQDKTDQKQTVEEMTKYLLMDALDRFDNVKEAAQHLGISVSTFYRKMKKFGLA
jgi:transcriptional regulator with PAS, ATPase and Fis domain